MGYDTSDRGSGIAVVLVVVLLLGFFVFLCLGIGAVMFLFRGQSNRVTPFAQPAMYPAGTLPGYPAILEEDESGSAYVALTPTVNLNSDGTVDLNGEEVPLESLGERVDQEALRHRTEYLALHLNVAADCPAETLLSVLRQVWESAYCTFDFADIQVIASQAENSAEEDSKEDASAKEAAGQEASLDESSENESSDDKSSEKQGSEEVDPESTDDASED